MRGDDSRSSARAVQLSNRVSALRDGTQEGSTCDTCGGEYDYDGKLCVCNITSIICIRVTQNIHLSLSLLGQNYLPSINSARYTQRIILFQTVKSGWSAQLSANCSPFRLPIRQQSAPPSADLPMADKFADNNIVVANITQKSFNCKS